MSRIFGWFLLILAAFMLVTASIDLEEVSKTSPCPKAGRRGAVSLAVIRNWGR